MISSVWKSFVCGYIKGLYGDRDLNIARRKKKMLKKYPEYPIIYDLNIGIMGEDWSCQKIAEVDRWLDDNFPNQWKLLIHHSDQEFDCDVFYHFTDEEIVTAFKLRWM